MRVIALDTDVLVVISRFWQTTCTAVRSGGEGLVVDSPVLPDELEALPKVLSEARFPVDGLLTTHADWDHLLGAFAFSEAPLGCAESTATRLAAEPQAAERDLREFDEKNYIQRPGPLVLGTVQALPVPGRVSIGERELELHRTQGHVPDGMAIFVPWARVLVCGDYLSPVEIPWISEEGSIEAYRATLERLRPLVAEAASVVPGHGAPLDSDVAMTLLDEDIEYLDRLERDGTEATLPAGRATSAQQRIHEANVKRL